VKQAFAKKLYIFEIITISMATEINSIKGTLIRLGFYPDEKSLLFDAFRALFEIRPELKTEIAVDLYRKGEASLWSAARVAGCNLEEFKDILRSRSIAIKISSTKQESDARLNRVFGA
jgi:predicted HTH domain antitoxin